jgi:meiotic recombination protein REC8
MSFYYHITLFNLIHLHHLTSPSKQPHFIRESLLMPLYFFTRLLDTLLPTSHGPTDSRPVARFFDYTVPQPDSSAMASHRLPKIIKTYTHVLQLLHNEMDQDLPMFGEDILEGQVFNTIQQQSSEQLDSSGPSYKVAATFTAPMRRKKLTIRALRTDPIMELRNKDLAAWNADYLKNMKEAARNKNRHRALTQAKKNAEFWVWGSGFGGIGHRVLGATGPTPFDQFHGDNLFQLCTGLNRNQVAGTKHDRDSGIDEATQEESRRVRHKSDIEEEPMGRGENDEGMFLLGEDEIGNVGVDEVELPRDAPAALDDQQVFSAMPWNISASIRGSSAVPRSALSGLHGSLNRRRGSRMVSASPLHGRGQISSLDALKDFEVSDDFGILGGNDFGMPGPSSDGAWVEPAQSVQTSFRIREALSTEGENFLAYVSGAIAEKRTRVEARVIDMSDVLQADATADIDEVLFEEILPSKENSKVVAAQGLLMVLALGTRGMLDVRQEEDFGEIGLSLTEKAKAVQIADAAEEDEGKEDQEEADKEGQFTEQLAAGSAEAQEGGDDHNSLYDD